MLMFIMHHRFYIMFLAALQVLNGVVLRAALAGASAAVASTVTNSLALLVLEDNIMTEVVPDLEGVDSRLCQL
jgi:hypothetical protein